ncbi:hypothetical protein NEAUS04_0883 [Nematocida ausubeli]|uniref:Uncharacterized protein n=1 Tax=Nematocida ausubeli (strain ATCC PRA-371 / ERTm2) TaxID=1913371 RepID=A0A086J0Z0_NEMA1|nr:uncharacterized protein NESG_01793 [Nematocida ausubeli]KAI5136600.1 hypothetical protein NEAUS06_1910 [Nematocida ausubeli]KAI5136656.1 hypothetical protein NEAUS07_1658 [Nematocida ausubeli]KAI5146597.1 hypothetical protein NEAUS05_0045 [Nematocida ausubeli]KAI5162122.1 hypothetical protein NEAUS04_0883 [Nematocida ausubeli]KFG25808.1 hypothetical protein NESG_01793 [Nematocida ausubeli]
MKYVEGMPLTSVVCSNGSVVIGGGGGNPLFGFPNRIILLDSACNEIMHLTVRDIILSLRAVPGAVLVEYFNFFEVFLIKDGVIDGPVWGEEGVTSAVLGSDGVYYVKNGLVRLNIWEAMKKTKLNTHSVESNGKEPEKSAELNTHSVESNGDESEKSTELSTHSVESNGKEPEKSTELNTHSVESNGEEQGNNPELVTLHAKSPVTEGENIPRLLTLHGKSNEYLIYSEKTDGIVSLYENAEETVLPGPISRYKMQDKAYSYIVQLKDDYSLVTMQYDGKIYHVLEKMCISVAVSEGVFYVGTGRGEVIAYKKGRVLWRKKIFTSPVTDLWLNGRDIWCTCINGRVIKGSIDGDFNSFLKFGILSVFMAGCMFAVKSWVFGK